MIEQLIHVVRLRQTELMHSLALGNAFNWESYQRMVGEYQGLKYTLDSLDNILREQEGRED
jgi:hypothetical protein